MDATYKEILLDLIDSEVDAYAKKALKAIFSVCDKNYVFSITDAITESLMCPQMFMCEITHFREKHVIYPDENSDNFVVDLTVLSEFINEANTAF